MDVHVHRRQLARWSALVGSVVAAAGASACCLGPLALGLLGLGGVGFAARLEPLRPILLAVTAAFLGVGFYLTYRRPRMVRATDGDEACCQVPRTARSARTLLWLASALVVAIAAYPWWARVMRAGGGTARTAGEDVLLHVDGMSCGACGRHISSELSKIAGILASDVDVSGKRVRVTYDPGRVTAPSIIKAVSDLGYEARIETEGAR